MLKAAIITNNDTEGNAGVISNHLPQLQRFPKPISETNTLIRQNV
jgi:hypothetical protein